MGSINNVLALPRHNLDPEQATLEQSVVNS